MKGYKLLLVSLVSGVIGLVLGILLQAPALAAPTIDTWYPYQAIQPRWGMGMRGMMGPGGIACPMGMQGMMGIYTPGSEPIGYDRAIDAAMRYLSGFGYGNFELGEVEEYSNNYYIAVMERDSGMGAMELIVDRFTGSVMQEPQSMAWNTAYGMMGYGYAGEPAIGEERALEIARSYLRIAYPGTDVGEITAYPGYYTIMVMKDGRHYGMLSVNYYTGQIWYHTWHGMFIGELEG